jgi:hypothetical protein
VFLEMCWVIESSARLRSECSILRLYHRAQRVLSSDEDLSWSQSCGAAVLVWSWGR